MCSSQRIPPKKILQKFLQKNSSKKIPLKNHPKKIQKKSKQFPSKSWKDPEKIQKNSQKIPKLKISNSPHRTWRPKTPSGLFWISFPFSRTTFCFFGFLYHLAGQFFWISFPYKTRLSDFFSFLFFRKFFTVWRDKIDKFFLFAIFKFLRHFKNTKLWPVSIIHQLALYLCQLMYYWKWS